MRFNPTPHLRTDVITPLLPHLQKSYKFSCNCWDLCVKNYYAVLKGCSLPAPFSLRQTFFSSFFFSSFSNLFHFMFLSFTISTSFPCFFWFFFPFSHLQSPPILIPLFFYFLQFLSLHYFLCFFSFFPFYSSHLHSLPILPYSYLLTLSSLSHPSFIFSSFLFLFFSFSSHLHSPLSLIPLFPLYLLHLLLSLFFLPLSPSHLFPPFPHPLPLLPSHTSILSPVHDVDGWSNTFTSVVGSNDNTTTWHLANMSLLGITDRHG